jgi:hypothetical protein
VQAQEMTSFAATPSNQKFEVYPLSADLEGLVIFWRSRIKTTIFLTFSLKAQSMIYCRLVVKNFVKTYIMEKGCS